MKPDDLDRASLKPPTRPPTDADDVARRFRDEVERLVRDTMVVEDER